MADDDQDQRIFTCPVHLFTTVAQSDGEVTCRGSQGDRHDDCPSCQKVVDEAFAYAGLG